MKVIELTRGHVAIVDDEDFLELAQYRWSALVCPKTVYARRAILVNGKQQAILMHRVIMNAPEEFEVDHRNRNGLDNRRENLRLATKAQNRQNAKLRKDNTSGTKGVTFWKRKNKWSASIQVNKQKIFLGHFSTIGEARAARDAATQQHHGEFARLN